MKGVYECHFQSYLLGTSFNSVMIVVTDFSTWSLFLIEKAKHKRVVKWPIVVLRNAMLDTSNEEIQTLSSYSKINVHLVKASSLFWNFAPKASHTIIKKKKKKEKV